MEFPMPQNPYDWKIVGRPKAVRYIEQTSTGACEAQTTRRTKTHRKAIFGLMRKL